MISRGAEERKPKKVRGDFLSGSVENVWKVFDYVFMFHILGNNLYLKTIVCYTYLHTIAYYKTYILSHGKNFVYLFLELFLYAFTFFIPISLSRKVSYA